jgi:hypothetical protein
MTRDEFEKKVFDLTNQLTELARQLPDNPELKDSLNGDDYDASKEAFILSIMALENDLEFLSDKYFDDGAERIAARLK